MKHTHSNIAYCVCSPYPLPLKAINVIIIILICRCQWNVNVTAPHSISPNDFLSKHRHRQTESNYCNTRCCGQPVCDQRIRFCTSASEHIYSPTIIIIFIIIIDACQTNLSPDKRDIINMSLMPNLYCVVGNVCFESVDGQDSLSQEFSYIPMLSISFSLLLSLYLLVHTRETHQHDR